MAPEVEATQQTIGQEQMRINLLTGAVLWGEMVEAWADLVDGAADKAGIFKAAFYQTLEGRNYEGFKLKTQKATATGGLFAEHREFEVVQFGVATVAVYIARIGDDLYVSWRTFLKARFSEWKLMMFVLVIFFLVGLLPMLFSVERKCDDFTDPRGRVINTDCRSVINSSTYSTDLKIGIIAVAVVCFFLLFSRNAQALFREKIHDFHFDDAIALGLVVHRSIIVAADRVGIDPALLAPKESVFNQQRSTRKPRI